MPPIPFIVGADRSGTTLLQAMLDAHPDLAIPPETYWLPEVVGVCEESRVPHAAFVRFVEQQPRWPLFGLESKDLQEVVFAVQPFDLTAAMRAVYQLYAHRAGKTRWGDKTPRYLIHLPMLVHLFPEAHFIHIVRDGRDQALSIMAAPWGPSTLPHAAQRWRNELQWARWTSGRVPHYLEIRYEDLVSSPEDILRRICHFIDLPWHPQMLDYPTSSQVAGNAAYLIMTNNLRVREAPHVQIGRWRTEMSDEDVDRFEAMAGDLLVTLGYDLSKPATPQMWMGWKIAAAMRHLRWRMRPLKRRLFR